MSDDLLCSEFARKRYARAVGAVSWRHHSEYMALNIERAYKPDGKPFGLYRAVCSIAGADRLICIGDTLDEIRRRVRDYKRAAEV